MQDRREEGGNRGGYQGAPGILGAGRICILHFPLFSVFLEERFEAHSKLIPLSN